MTQLKFQEQYTSLPMCMLPPFLPSSLPPPSLLPPSLPPSLSPSLPPSLPPSPSQFPICTGDQAISVACLDLHYSVSIRVGKQLKDEKKENFTPIVLSDLRPEDELNGSEVDAQEEPAESDSEFQFVWDLLLGVVPEPCQLVVRSLCMWNPPWFIMLECMQWNSSHEDTTGP